MAVVDTIKKLFEYRENISDMIRLKDIDIPQNTKLKNIPQYINELEKKKRIDVQETWSEEFQNQCVAESLANYIEERSSWNGHVDADGLREIGWTEDDIDYFQENGVDWNEEDDDLYLVSDYEKELYRTNAIRVVSSKTEGAATYTSTLINNNDPQIVEWRNNIRWMPKFTNLVMPSTISFRNFREMIGCPYFDFSKTSNPSYMFARCDKLRCIPPISFYTGATTWNGEYMFYECASIKTIPTSIDWSKCYRLFYTFADCTNILYLPEFDLSSVSSMTNSFTNCQSLIGISNLTTSDKLTVTESTFAGCRSVLTLPYFNTSKCTSMKNMISNCQSIYNIPTYDTSSNKNFETFFRNCSNLLSCPDLNFNGGVTTYSSMFMGCEKLIRIPNGMNFDSCTNISSMCYRCLKITEFPYKLNFNNTATNPSEGIKSYTNCFYYCTNLRKLDIGSFKHSASSASDTNILVFCPFIEEINVDNFNGEKGILLTNADLFRVLRIGGELKGITQSMNLSAMRKLPRESMLKIIDAIEDVNGLDYVPILTFGTEALRNLTVEEKLIVTNKGWKLA